MPRTAFDRYHLVRLLTRPKYAISYLRARLMRLFSELK